MVIKFALSESAFGIVTAFLFLLLAVPIGIAQEKEEKWERVVTESAFVVDVDTSSLVLGPDNLISAKFKTTLSKSEDVTGTSGAKYKIRLENIQFNRREAQYRIYETSLLDSSGKVVLTYSSGQKGWKAMRGNAASRLYNKAALLHPFGYWRVISYRYADGDREKIDDDAELKKLVGSSMYFDFFSVNVGKQNCSSPNYESKTVTNEEFTRRIGSHIKDLGLNADRVEAIIMKCESSGSSFSQSFIIPLPDGKMLMLWEGVFLEMEKRK